MYEANGSPVKCKCGKPAGSAAIGKEAYVAWCSDCSPMNKQAGDFVYRPPNVKNSNIPEAQNATIGVKFAQNTRILDE